MRGLIVLVILAGCGGGNDLTCAVLADPGNCWASAAAQVAACLPMRATPATLSADRTACNFADGSSVHFDTPLPTSTTQLTGLAFDITGAGCSARFVDRFHIRLELTVEGKTVV
ncbi:MAG: hypothetical protein JWO36_939, partial [Myxococcales bacterium]|nr:hypothetical protein [Myxococcales bacterium]